MVCDVDAKQIVITRLLSFIAMAEGTSNHKDSQGKSFNESLRQPFSDVSKGRSESQKQPFEDTAGRRNESQGKPCCDEEFKDSSNSSSESQNGMMHFKSLAAKQAYLLLEQLYLNTENQESHHKSRLYESVSHESGESTHSMNDNSPSVPTKELSLLDAMMCLSRLNPREIDCLPPKLLNALLEQSGPLRLTFAFLLLIAHQQSLHGQVQGIKEASTLQTIHFDTTDLEATRVHDAQGHVDTEENANQPFSCSNSSSRNACASNLLLSVFQVWSVMHPRCQLQQNQHHSILRQLFPASQSMTSNDNQPSLARCLRYDHLNADRMATEAINTLPSILTDMNDRRDMNRNDHSHTESLKMISAFVVDVSIGLLYKANPSLITQLLYGSSTNSTDETRGLLDQLDGLLEKRAMLSLLSTVHQDMQEQLNQPSNRIGHRNNRNGMIYGEGLAHLFSVLMQ